MLDSSYIMNAQPSFVDATYKITKRVRSQALSPALSQREKEIGRASVRRFHKDHGSVRTRRLELGLPLGHGIADPMNFGFASKVELRKPCVISCVSWIALMQPKKRSTNYTK